MPIDFGSAEEVRMRFRGGKDTTDQYHAFDIRRLHRIGALRPGCQFTQRWTWNGTPTGVMVGWREQDCITLFYRYRDRGCDEWISRKFSVRLTWTACNYGGRRSWLVCPARGCGRRVAVLYGNGIFACRRCFQLAYESQRETDDYRALRRAQTIRERLGGTANMLKPFPQKPKGMHWRTYVRLQAEHDRAGQRSTMGMAIRLGMLTRRTKM